MANRKSKLNDSEQKIPHYSTFKDFCDHSPFWLRLRSFKNAQVDQLCSTIQDVETESQAIAKKIIKCMPFYSLHDERHLLNLLGWLEVLTPQKTIGKMSPLEVGLCILGVLVHDLGMAQPLNEQRAITSFNENSPDFQAFELFAEVHFDEELRLAQHLETRKESAEKARAQLIRQHILSEFLRSTHATGSRIRQWLAEMKTMHGDRLFYYGSLPFEDNLVLIAASHNQPVYWLREQLQSIGAFHHLVGNNERVNYAFPGLLLRLADIMDFDSSRTPPILYRHLGLDEDLGIHLTVSHNEWNKHLAITGIDYKVIDGQPTIIYAACDCPYAVVEKSIRTFVGWIEDELQGVRSELGILCQELTSEGARLVLTFPTVKTEIEARKKGGRRSYIYKDIQFRLDQDEILRLLTGEKLYGNPSLCIRELLQNALDACELRDLRLQLKAKGERPIEPVDGTPCLDSRGYFLDEAGQKRRLEVRLTWGHDGKLDQYWLQVEDNGIGMTEHVITRYFTQIGKSYYTSAEFREEQVALRSSGLLATPVSKFGIGILSCFMLADRIEVRTCPGGHDPDRPARDITISGPGSLFWLRDGTRTTQGTEVKLWLKHKTNKTPLKLEHDPDRWLAQLRLHFEYMFSDKDFDQVSALEQCNWPNVQVLDYPPYPITEGTVDPAYAAGQWVVWPRYPIVLEGLSRSAFELNDRFHMDYLTPIDCVNLLQKAEEWEVPAEWFSDVRWGTWDWEDAITGSRIRLWFPCWDQVWTQSASLPIDPSAGSPRPLCRQRELAAFVEPQLQINQLAGKAFRQRMLLHGFFVPNGAVLQRASRILAGNGAWVWVDLRGGAALPLTADSNTAIAAEDTDAWLECVDGMFNRFMKFLCEHVRQTAASRTNVLASWSGVIAAGDQQDCFVAGEHRDTHDWWKAIEPVCPISSAFLSDVFLQSVLLERDPDLYREWCNNTAVLAARSLNRDEVRHYCRYLTIDLADCVAKFLNLGIPLAGVKTTS